VVQEMLWACHQEISPLEPYRSLADTIGFLRFPPAAEARVCWTVAESDSLCGFAAVRHMRGAATAWLELRVHPGQRRRKAGTALLAAARAYASASGVRTLLGHYAGTAGAGGPRCDQRRAACR
jgi:GNAT superfamily N-acetyltransferase